MRVRKQPDEIAKDAIFSMLNDRNSEMRACDMRAHASSGRSRRPEETPRGSNGSVECRWLKIQWMRCDCRRRETKNVKSQSMQQPRVRTQHATPRCSATIGMSSSTGLDGENITRRWNEEASIENKSREADRQTEIQQRRRRSSSRMTQQNRQTRDIVPAIRMAMEDSRGSSTSETISVCHHACSRFERTSISSIFE